MARERQTDENEIDPTVALMARMLEIQQQQAAALQIQTDRTAPRENPNYVAKSIFLKPNEEPWAADLKCAMYFGPVHLNRTPLTEDEVKALNSLQPVEKAAITKTDGSMQRATVRAREDAVGRLERLTVEVDLKKDTNPQHFPGIIAWATELAAQAQAVAA